MEKNEDKAMAYDDIVRQADKLQREISRLNSIYPIRKPNKVYEQIEKNKEELVKLETKLKDLFG